MERSTVIKNNGWPVRHLFGVPIEALTMDEVLSIVDDTIERRQRLLIGMVNAAKLVNMRRDESLGQSVREADMILADGMAVVWACWLLGRRLPERIPGIDLMHHMLKRSSERGHRVYCLGAEEEVLSKAVMRMQVDHPGLAIAGYQHGYYDAEDEPRIVERIRASKPDILLVAMTSPKKERFLARWSDRMDVPVCHGVGGSFDILAGKTKRAPRALQNLGLEWLYRVIQEPRRLWRRYLVTNSLFCTMLVAEFFGYRPSVSRLGALQEEEVSQSQLRMHG